MRLIWNSRKRRASAVVMVLAMMFVLLILVAGMHWRQSSARSSLLREEANLEARVAAEYELAKQVHPEATFAPEKQTVRAALAAHMAIDLPKGLAKPLFQYKVGQGLTNLIKSQAMPQDPKLLGRPGKAWNLVVPNSLDPAMQPDKVKFLSVVTNDFPYAACAPNGTIKVAEAHAWSNELFKVGYSTETAMSGKATVMSAGGNIEVGNLTYGELYTANGTVSVDQGRFIAYPGPPGDLANADAYPNIIAGQVTDAMTKLSAAAQDKTNLINGNILGIDTIVSLFTGKVSDFLGKALSMRQAMQMPFFMIPGGKVQGIIVTMWLHMPFPPDGAGAKDQLDELQKKQQAELGPKQTAIAEQHTKVADLEKETAAQTDAEAKKKKQQELDKARSDEEALGTDLKDTQEKFGNEVNDILDKVPDAETTGPLTRNDDAKITGDDGVEWMSYKAFYKRIFKFCSDVVVAAFESIRTGEKVDMSAVLKDLYQEVRLVHFGAKDRETNFTIKDGSVEMTATFNVPPGRAIKLRTDVTINGDLWLMRGSTLVVDGNLTLVNPESSLAVDPRKPRGRLFLEEGAKLIVTKDFVCGGDSALGSVLVGAPIHAIHPTTSAIMVNGNITIPFGVWPAFSLGDLELDEVPVLKDLRDVVSTVVPNVAKLSGPFHRRKAYFSKHATMYVIACILVPPIPVPIPLPIPTPLPPGPANANVKLFKAMALIYSTQMNLAWGENFITHCDWWFIGQGCVPMLPKINPTVYIDKIKNFNFPSISSFPSPDQVQKLLEQKGPQMVKEMAPVLISEVIVKIVISQLSFGLADFVTEVVPLQEWIDKIVGVEDTQKSLAEISGLTAVLTEIKSKIADEAALMMLQETPGVLIYAGGRIGIAEGGHRAPVTIGMLVAGGDIVSNAKYTVGACMSLHGSITTNQLLYDANCTRCSMFVPQVAPTSVIPDLEWFNWAVEYRYGALLEVGEPLDVGPTLRYPSIQGWHE